MSEELNELQRRIERLIARQRELDARLWTLENSRVFRILQRIGIVANSIKFRLRRVLHPGAEATAKRRAYQSWLDRRLSSVRDITDLACRPRFQVVTLGDQVPRDPAADYIVFVHPEGKLTPNALYDLAEAVQQERFEVLYGDEDCESIPLFKPEWSPELAQSPMFLGRLLAVRRDALEAAGEFRDVLELVRQFAKKGARFHRVPRLLVSAAQPFVSPPLQSRKVQGTPLVSIVICSRSAKLLRKCLSGIERGTGYPNREIVVVDHEMESARTNPAYTRVPYSGAFDFAAMNNLGVKSAKGDVIVFLNDDVEPLDPAWLGAMVAQAQRHEVGAVGALLLYPDGSIQHAGIALGLMGYTGHPGRGTFDGGFWPWVFVTRNVSAVTGACLAIRRDVFEQLGGFDPHFPVNFNDVDLCLRARQAGYEVIFEASARLRHFESRTRSRGVAWEERERFWERWGDQIAQGDPYYNPNLTTRGEDCGLPQD